MDSKRYDGTKSSHDNLEDEEFIPDVVVVGVGFVGLTLSMALCRLGLRVLGIDRNQELVDSLSLGVTHVLEPDIDDLLHKAVKNRLFRACSENESFIRKSDKPVTFILTVGTPIVNRKVDNESLIRATEHILPLIRSGDLVLLRSTVEIGTSRNIVMPILSRLKVRCFLAMCPERTVEGNALAEIALLPQIVGGIDEESSDRAKDFFEKICEKVIVLSSIESAELLKLANNTFRDLQFAFANEITALAKSVGVRSSEIIQAANFQYERSRIPLPGPSGGPCLEKDPWILVESGRKFGIDLPISKASRIVNESLTLDFVLNAIGEFRSRVLVQVVGILGLSFKARPVVRDSRGAFSKTLVQTPRLADLVFCGYEPGGVVDGDYETMEICESVEEVLEKSDITILATNFQGFAGVIEKMDHFAGSKTKLIIDMWNQIDPSRIPERVEYLSWG